jgi:hypothetical protein
MTQSSKLAFVTSLADTDSLLCNAGGLTKQILVSDFKKVVGSTGSTGTGSTGSTGTKNLFSTPTQMGAGLGSKFADYQPNGEIGRPGGLVISIKSPYTGPCIIYEEISTTTLVPGQIYTVGANVTRTAGSGSGYVIAHGDWQGGAVANDPNIPTPQDGVSYRTYATFKVPTGVPNSHIGYSFVGPGTFTLANVTLVAGSVDLPNAT